MSSNKKQEDFIWNEEIVEIGKILLKTYWKTK